MRTSFNHLKLSGCLRISAAWAALATASLSAHGELIHRWSFNNPAGDAPAGTVLADTVSALPMTVRGVGAAFDGTRLALPGTTSANQPEASISAYLDLPNGIISSKTDLTLEFWAAPLGGREWAPLFDFGRWNGPGDGLGAVGEWTGNSSDTPPGDIQSGAALALLLSRFSELNQQRLGIVLNEVRTEFDSNLPTTPGQTYHYVLTVRDGVGAFGANGMQVAWYRDGSPVGSVDVDYHLSDIEDVNCWLGRLQWTSLGIAHVAYDEARIYNHAFDQGEVSASLASGPNAVFPPPVLQPDSATLHRGQKVRITVLANDPPGVSPGSVQVAQAPQFGTATPDDAGRILYHHTTGTPTSDTFTYQAAGTGGTAEPVTVTLNFANSLRIANASLNVPDQPPVTAIQLVPAFTGLTFAEPISVASPPGDTQRLFVIERRAGLRVIPDVTATSPASAVFLDLAALLGTRGEMIGNTFDQGIMGLAFHPDYANNRHFFLTYSVRTGGLDYYRLSRFTAQAGNPNAADPASELVLLQQRDENGYHLALDLHFGPDGYLYLSVGDGGGQNDSRGYGQLIDHDFFCAILRLDVDKQPGNREPNLHAAVPRDGGIARYSVPADNPFVTDDEFISYNGEQIPATSVRTEFFAHGFRVPWRFSFDSQTGELWCGDVGQVAREEVNLVVNGGNYGWAWREGTLDGPRAFEAPLGFTSVAPLYEYGQGNGSMQGFSISGGLVHHGDTVAGLTGAYVFADYVSGNIWTLRRNGQQVEVQRVAGETGITSFGLDPATGDLLAVDHGGSRILRVTAGGQDLGDYPQTLSETGLFADLTDLSPAPAVLPYAPNLRFWSDYAAKRRWFVIPDLVGTMTWSRDDPWSYPDGMVFVKHFDLELERGNPATSRRIETRLLVKNAGGTYGVSYRWNEAQTDATLVADAGANFDLDVTENGVPRVQSYRIPSRAECLACHTPQAGHVLSFDTRQLNQAASINGFAGNQLDLLHDAGYFANEPEPPNVLPRHVRPDETDFPLEARVRSYLAVNCANCHRAGGTAPPSWDGRASLTLAQTGLINGAAENNGGDPANRLVVPGDTLHSVILNRIATANGFTRMPSIGSNELDQESIALLTAWITQSLPNRLTYAQWRLNEFQSATSPEGEPGFDADGDGATNEAEFLGGTDPLFAGSRPLTTITSGPGSVTLGIDLPMNRSFQIETTPDFEDWSLWNVPGNQGLPVSGGLNEVSGPAVAPFEYFRVRLRGN